MKILSSTQTAEADQQTIEKEQISSWTLMERAASALCAALRADYPQGHFTVISGMGNNGGDGLALARLLYLKGHKVRVCRIEHSTSASRDNETNWQLLSRLPLQRSTCAQLAELKQMALEEQTILVDALLGAGLNRPLKGLLAEVVDHLKDRKQATVAIDIPTGLFADDNRKNDLERVWQPECTYTFQHPKLALLHPDTASLGGALRVLDIGLDPSYYQSAKSKQYFLETDDIRSLYQPVDCFSYKNRRGHALLLAGSPEKAGACHLAASGALKTGLGLCTALVHQAQASALNQTWPELMLRFRENRESEKETYDALMIGPGMGKDTAIWDRAKKEVENTLAPVLLDADAIRLVARDKTWLKALDRAVILSPHPGEWKALQEGEEQGEPLASYRQFAEKYQVYLLLKGKVSVLSYPDGQQFFSDFGHPSLAKGGSGDVLSGVIVSCLAQGYAPGEAVKLALFLHGKAAQLGAKHRSTETLTSGVLHHYFGAAFGALVQ